jgi:hypothetical protein
VLITSMCLTSVTFTFPLELVCPLCVCSFVSCVSFEPGVLFCVLCLIVVPLPPGKNPFAVKINK